MRSTRLALAILLGALALSPPAIAQRVELAGRVTASRTVLSQRRVGEARYVAISDLFYRDRSAVLEVLDLATLSVVQVTTNRALLERRFGAVHDGATTAPQGEVAVYTGDVVGVVLAQTAAGGPRRCWYVELDARSGKLLRTAGLATLGEGEQLEIIGADPVDGRGPPAGSATEWRRGSIDAAAWFAITRITGHGRELVLRRLDLSPLGSLEAHDEQRVALSVRAATPRGEHAVQVHAAADFSRFAIVEYVEDGVRMAPGHVYIAEPATGTSFAVPAPPTAYGVAFSPDGRYVYLGSAQLGTISRIDVAAGRIDKQVAAPHYLHHLVVSASGTRLFALASSNMYAVYDLPDLKTRSDAAHAIGVASAMVQLSGNGVASLDGAYFVVPEAEDRHKPPAHDRGYVIAHLVE